MHSLIVTISIGLIILTQSLGLSLTYATTATLLAVCVGLIGLPHGALDHKIGRRLFSSLSAPTSYALFLTSYLAVAAVVVAGWILSPLLTVLGFFSLSAWHFGLEEDERSSLSRLEWLAMVARGGMIIWIPIALQGGQIVQLLTLILPSGSLTVAAQIVSAVAFVAPLLALLTLYDAITYQNARSGDWMGLSTSWQHRLRLAAFAILFATADPLVSFGIYFCGWHSVRGLIHLREQFELPTGSFLLKLVPISGLAVGLFIAGYLFSREAKFVTPAIVQTLFIGLSAVAIPHLLLHIIVDSIRSTEAPGAVVS